jgi:hypothetical protein
MTYRYRLSGNRIRTISKPISTTHGANGWKLVSMVWDYDNSRFVCAFVKEAA